MFGSVALSVSVSVSASMEEQEEEEYKNKKEQAKFAQWGGNVAAAAEHEKCTNNVLK